MKIRALIVLAAILLYGTTLAAPFHFDDYSLLTDPAVVVPEGVAELLQPERTRPLTYLTFWLNYRLGGTDPLGFHLLNVLLFGVAVFSVGRAYEQALPERAAVIGTAVFAFHPLAVEPVAYVFGRASVLAVGFCALSWSCWMAGRRGWAMVAFVAAVLSKEEAVALPVFLLGYEVFVRRAGWERARGTLGWLLAMLGVGVLSGVRVLHAARVTPGAGALVELGDVTPWSYLLTQGKVIWLYLRLLVAPVGLSFDHSIGLATGLEVAVVACWAGVIALAVVSLWLAWKGDEHWYWVAGGLLLLAPTSSLAPLADLAAERRMLLPLMSLAAAVGVLVVQLPRRAVVVVGVGLALALGGLSAARIQVWSSEEALWRDTVEKAPRKARPRLQLSRALEGAGPNAVPERLALLKEARRLEAENPDAAAELGLLLMQTRDEAGAVTALEDARRLAPQDPQIAANLGTAYFLSGRGADAERTFRAALATDPCNFDARNNLLLALRSRGASEPDLVRVPDGCRWSEQQRSAFASPVQ